MLSHLSSDLLSPAKEGNSITLVLTDWHGRMPQEVQVILRSFIQAQGEADCLRLTGLDLHGKIGWFIDLLHERRDTFEAKDGWLQSLELSLVEESSIDKLPRFGNLRVLRVYQPELGSESRLVELLRSNLHQLNEVACVASTTAAPFRAAVHELDQLPARAGVPSSLAELAAASILDLGATAASMTDQSYPPMVVAVVEQAQAEAEQRITTLWLRGGQAHVTEALELLGQAIARNRELSNNAKTFIGRLGRLRLELPNMPAPELDAFRRRAAQLLRDERLGLDAKLNLRVQVESQARQTAREEETVLMCLFDLSQLTIGIESVSGLFLPIIPRNSTVPTRRHVLVRWDEDSGGFAPVAAVTQAASAPNTSEGAAHRMRAVRVFCGERVMAADNELMGEVEVTTGSDPTQLRVDLSPIGRIQLNGTQLAGHYDGYSAEQIAQFVQEGEAAAVADHAQRDALLQAAGLTAAQFLTAAHLHQFDTLALIDETD